MRNISRRTALRGGTATVAAIAAGGAVAARIAVDDPLMDLWHTRADLWRRADRLNEEFTKLEATLPAWVKKLPGVEVDFHGRKPVICRTPGEVKTAMLFVGVPAHLVYDKTRWNQYCDKIRTF